MILKEKYSFKEHLDRFATDQMCHDYLVQIRWSGRPECPKCGNNHMNYYVKSRNIFKCSNSDCKKQFSAIQGTIFQRSKVPLTKWFLAIYIFTTKKRGISSCQLAKWLGVKQHTAWYMLHRLREAMKNENEILLQGVVEVDETFVGPKVGRDKRLQYAQQMHEKEQDRLHGYRREKRYKMGVIKKKGRKKGSTKEVLEQKKIERGGTEYNSHASDRIPFEKGAVILGMVEQGGKVVMKKLGVNWRSVTRKNIFPHLKKHIFKDSIVTTDQLTVYDTISTLFKEHKTVNHKKGYVINDIHINGVENAWKHLKKMVDGTYFHLSHHHFDGYLNENTFRWNRRDKSEKFLFEDFMPLLAGKSISYEKLKQRKDNKLAA